MSKYYGQYGGKVLRGFQGPKGLKFIQGATLTPEMVEDWPISNRMALHSSGKVDWYGPPADAEERLETSRRRRTTTPKKDEKEKPEKSSRRTTRRTK